MFGYLTSKVVSRNLKNIVTVHIFKSSNQIKRKAISPYFRFIHKSCIQQTQEQKPRMGIVCTCNVCQNRFSKTFTKHSYEKGVVIIKCPQCSSNHLIADHLSWFKDINFKNIEEILAAKGEEVRKYMKESDVDHTGVIEIDHSVHEDSKKNQDSQKLPIK